MLEEKYVPPPDSLDLPPHSDRNAYTFGKVGEHYVVIGCLPRGRTGSINAANVASDMIHSFPSLKCALMVGIGGGAPLRRRDIRLGDVVVSTPSGDHGGVVQLNFGVQLQNGLFKRRGHLNAVPDILLAATQNVQLRLDDPDEPDRIAQHIARMDSVPSYQRPALDQLYLSKYEHRDPDDADVEDEEDDGNWDDDEDEDPCRFCEKAKLVKRKTRNGARKVTVHYGTIASDNVVMRDAIARDRHAKDSTLKIHCFEMEAAGLMNSLQCIVIRGISDYSDTHKSDVWHNYAALTAAAYARELLICLRPQLVRTMPSWTDAAQESK